MLTEVEAEPKAAFEEQGRMQQHVRDYAKANARRNVGRKFNLDFLDSAAQRLLGARGFGIEAPRPSVSGWPKP
jgi:hypothetical protein